MKKTLTAISIATLLFIGCGSSGGGSSSKPNENNNANNNNNNNNDNGNTASGLLTKARVVNGSSRGLNFRNKSNTKSPTKMHQKLKNAKVGSEESLCGISGTITETKLDETSFLQKFNQCVYYDSNQKMAFEDGYLGFQVEKNSMILIYQQYKSIPDYKNKPRDGEYYTQLGVYFADEEETKGFYIDGDINIFKNNSIIEVLKYEKFYYLTDNNNALYVQGVVTDTFECFTEKSTFKTDEKNWLITHESNEDYFKSGTITINGLKYVYKGENVTLSQNGETETFAQSDVLESFAETSERDDCSNQNNLGFTEQASAKTPAKLSPSFSKMLISKGFKKTIFE